MKKLLLITTIFFATATVHAQHIPKWKMTDLVQYMNQKSDSILVINFWATFCKPCVAEIPDFINVTNKYKNQKVKLLLVSLDLPSFYPAKIAAFATKHKFTAGMVWLNETNADYFCPMIDSGWSGAIPATVIVNTTTGYKKFFEAEMMGKELEEELKKAMEENKTSLIKPKFFMPMNEAKITEHNKKLIEADFPSYGVTFKAKDSTVYSVDEGMVGNCLSFEDSKVVIIEHQGFSYFYYNLKNVIVKNGDLIKRNQVIGYAATEFNEPMYTLNFNILKRSNQMPLTKDDFILRKNDNSKDHSFDPVDPE